MPLGDKTDQIQTLIDGIRTTHSGYLTGLPEPPEKDFLDNLETEKGSIKTTGEAFITDEAVNAQARMISKLTATDRIIAKEGIADTSCAKYNLLNLIDSGAFLDNIISTLTGIVTQQDLIDNIESILDEALEKRGKIDEAQTAINNTKTLLDDATSVLMNAALGSAFDPALVSCLSNFFPTLSAQNPTFHSSMNNAKTLQDEGKTSSEIFDSLITSGKTSNNIDTRQTDVVDTLNTLAASF